MSTGAKIHRVLIVGFTVCVTSSSLLLATKTIAEEETTCDIERSCTAYAIIPPGLPGEGTLGSFSGMCTQREQGEELLCGCQAATVMGPVWNADQEACQVY
jgi:hypothetical protein